MNENTPPNRYEDASAAEKPNVEQAIREWLEDPASLEPGAIFSLSRDRSQLLVDQIAADRLHSAEQVAANWQRILNARTESVARTIAELLNGIPGARESIARGRGQFARGEEEAQAPAAANEVKLALLREDFQQLARLARRQSEGNAFAVQVALVCEGSGLDQWDRPVGGVGGRVERVGRSRFRPPAAAADPSERCPLSALRRRDRVEAPP